MDTKEALLQAAAEAQSAFWDALGLLENELGVDIDGTQDLASVTLTELLESGEKDGDDDED